ncbi:MAG: methyl-accepting chemotaxis protein [Nostocaceae cyanobacterium]|nr:methyl-accepting chemotaxis protein [Nostocaceae cyanobacterium]
MTVSLENYQQTYQQAYKAYVQGNYEEAANLVDQVVDIVQDDPNIHLLRGHVYFVLQQYEVAKAEYKTVLELSDDQEIINLAKNGLENIDQQQQQVEYAVGGSENSGEISPMNSDSNSQELAVDQQEPKLEINRSNFSNRADENTLLEYKPPTEFKEEFKEEISLSSPFEMDENSGGLSDSSENVGKNPFAFSEISDGYDQSGNNMWEETIESDLSPVWQEESSFDSLSFPENDESERSENSKISVNNNLGAEEDTNDLRLRANDLEVNQKNIFTDEKQQIENQFLVTNENKDFPSSNFDNENLFLDESSRDVDVSIRNNLSETSEENFSATGSLNNTFNLGTSEIKSQEEIEEHLWEHEDSFDFEDFSAFGSEELTADEDTNSIIKKHSFPNNNNIEFLDDFDDFNDLGDIPGFDITDSSVESNSNSPSGQEYNSVSNTGQFLENSTIGDTGDQDDELFSITGSQDGVPVFTQSDISNIEPQVSVEQGWLAPLENAPLGKKEWLIAITVGVVSSVAVAAVSFAATNFSPPEQRESVRNTGWAMALAAGIASFATTGVMGSLSVRQIRRTTKDLQAQFDSVRQGNLNVLATVYSEDEFGQLSTGFNEMAQVILATTNEARHKAQQQEEANENLQRQVIRLLDDVEGAARGDLTVQAEVTASVLGAVADAFNLTIQNLRDIVQQVKVAAKEVTKGATNSETFARALSSDALRQAEELAVTLNSVQVMTDSIQRVAEATREAEAVAHDASNIAIKGGEAVENTVAGILEIRETVAETTRKVKRLAESSQEISKIVALISQIASRTNLLALNASIEAARAGEAGRGFAIVADEVRQLADKSAKSLKEIEQIVMQIQSETGSVMTAMEEGTQQVIKSTKLAEEAKVSLDNIIRVAQRIDILVRSITADTVNQTDTSRAVAQVMQSVELTAQETSQEAQRVSGALQHLVAVSRDLISSVERFRVETNESR